MRRTLLALALAGLLLLSGCSAILNRSYAQVSAHPEHPGTGEDASTLTVGRYPELVSAVLYFVSRAQEEGSVMLVDYDGDAEHDLSAACQEILEDDPLGAYAVESIRSSCTRVLAAYEARIFITYRRTAEQIHSLVSVTGASAIREMLGEALAEFQTETALRVGYFTEDEDYICELVRQAYYDNPASALGMPAASVSLYPDHGKQRIAEIRLTYDQPAQVLRARSTQTAAAAARITGVLQEQQPRKDLLLISLLQTADEELVYRPQRQDGSAASTAWDVLADGGGDDEGLALAFRLLCDRLGLNCIVKKGTLDGAPRWWDAVFGADGEELHVDLSRDGAARAYTAEEFAALGYVWQ